jgi:hypothetical protein
MHKHSVIPLSSALLALTLLAAAATGSAQAQTTNNFTPHSYVTLEAGAANAPDVCKTVSSYGASCSTNAAAENISFGYAGNRNLGFEAAFTNVGDFTASLSGNGLTEHFSANGYAIQWSLIPTVPLGDSVSLFGRVGVVYTSATATASGVIAATGSNNKTNATFGGGVQVQFNPTFFGRVQYQYFGDVGGPNTLGTTKLSTVTAGVGINF